MNTDQAEQRIATLDPGLFERIPSQTSRDERMSLLAIQTAIRNRNRDYAYLEIGSYLGGSIQPYLLDPRCVRVYSIDTRPGELADDRSPGCVVRYEQNSEAHMLELLAGIDATAVLKVQCFNSDASKVDPDKVVPRPSIAFIDGQHTHEAVLSDFAFCQRVICPDGIVAFHDTEVIYGALRVILGRLRVMRTPHLGMRLGDNVFAISFSLDILQSNPQLAEIARQNRARHRAYETRQRIKSFLPSAVVELVRRFRSPSQDSRQPSMFCLQMKGKSSQPTGGGQSDT